jgi:hypothetical protein
MTPRLIARARFEMLPGEISGKSRGYLSNVRPNHYIAELGHTVIGNVEFDGGGIELGQARQAVISYLYFEPLARLLVPGFRYEVREGSRLVGFVEILELDPG